MKRWTYFAFVTAALYLLGFATGEEQIQWTPNDDAENAPLPLSMKQRQQLLQLEQAIRSSPDPNGTLEQVAESNGMSPQELVNMLQKNARDLQENPSLAQPVTIPKVLSRTVASGFFFLSQLAKNRPRSFAVSSATLIFLLYVTISLPRTGMHFSNSRKFGLSSGPSCLTAPNQKYLQKLIDSPGVEKKTLGIKAKKTRWDDLSLEEDGMHIHTLSRKSELSIAVSTKVTFETRDYLEGEEDEEFDEEGSLDRENEITRLLFDSASSILSKREFTEFPSDGYTLRSAASSDRHKYCILGVPGLGDFGRYGLVFLQNTSQLESEKDVELTLTTLKGMGFFDGQIHFQVRKFRSRISLQIHLVVPKRGRKISASFASKLISEISESLATSITRKTEQTVARTKQGKRFKSSSHKRAQERRASRFEREKLIEEMAEERRRKWQRGNPNSGRYRPSGDRQRSPNNC